MAISCQNDEKTVFYTGKLYGLTGMCVCVCVYILLYPFTKQIQFFHQTLITNNTTFLGTTALDKNDGAKISTMKVRQCLK